MAVTDDLTDARNRLIPVFRLHHVAALPDFAWLSARAAEQLSEADEVETDEAETDEAETDEPDASELFAYLVEYTDQHAKGWHQAPSAEHSEGVTLADTAEDVAEAVLTRYITHLADHRDDYQLWLVDSLFLRANVWHLDTAEAHCRGARPSSSSSAHTFNEAAIPPHAVEIRTPLQIHRFIDHHIIGS